MSFHGQTIVVTGAASGMGLETARQLADRGANVAMLDIGAEAVEAVAAAFPDQERVFWAAADTADTEAMEKATAGALGRFGRVDGLVANAGVRMQSTPVTELSDEAWDRIIRINLRGAFVAMRAGARAMKATKTPGSIVTVASISGQVGRMDQSAYAASKAGAVHLSKALAVELAGFGIRVNAVCPGTVKTAMFQLALAQDGERLIHDRIYGSSERLRPGIPLRRLAESEDVSALIVFLLSQEARHITGQAIAVDGGETAL
ncbi:SDR family NAD(P)-dependent oxidoreductase [Xanthobacter sediminis]